jgi:hypothetical protein
MAKRRQKVTNAEIAAAIRKLEDKDGRVTAEELVEAARSPKHPLHNRFVWNDAAAAHSHRIDTARQLIRGVYMPVRRSKSVIRAPIYVHDPSLPQGEPGYRAVMRFRDDRTDAHAALSAEVARLNSIIERVRGLAIVLGIEEAVDALDEQVAAFAEELSRLRPEEGDSRRDHPAS